MAKLNVIRSNRLETLVDLMGERLRTQLPANPIAPIDVVVGSRGMERWLRHRLAMHFGICCNMHFPFPAMKFDALVTNILGESMVEREAWGGASLAFAILDVLPLLVERQEFEAVHGYLASWDAPVSAKAFGLAGQLAAMFERYIDYRPELAVGVYVGENPPVRGGPGCLLRRLRKPLLAEIVDGLLDVSRILDQGVLAVHHSGTGEFPELRSRTPILRPDLLLKRLVPGIMERGRLGVVLPSADQKESQRKKWASTGLDLELEAASPYTGTETDFRAAARRLASRGADLIVLDCIGFTERMKRVFREESGKPVILPRTLLGRVAGELAGCVG